MEIIDFVSSTDRQGQLMLAYAAGDAAAFDELYQHYKGQLYRYFLRQCGNRALAEELYHELWMRVIQHRASYQHKARFSTWLYHIAHNLLLDHVRHKQPEAVDDETLELQEADDNYDPVIQHDIQQRLSQFLSMLHSLPAEQRQVFLLKEEAGLSLEEIAQVTGVGFESVKSRLRYAVKKLRQALIDAA